MLSIKYKPKEHWGTFLWGFIHTITLIDNDNNIEQTLHVIEKLQSIKDVIPCPACYNKYNEFLDKLRFIDVRQSLSLFYWSVDLHNAVNIKLGRATWSYRKALDTWSTKL